MNEKMKDILYYVREFRSELALFFEKLSHHSNTQRVKMLLDYLSDREKQCEKNITKFETNISTEIGDKEIQISELNKRFFIMKKKLYSIEFENRLSVDDVIEVTVNMHKNLQDFYTYAIEKSENNPIKNIFQQLLKMEIQFIKEIVRDAQELKDL